MRRPWLPSRVEERYLAYYRKGYCELFGALVTKDSDTFQSAAKDFTDAIANWPKKGHFAAARRVARADCDFPQLERGLMADSYPETARDLTAIVAESSRSSRYAHHGHQILQRALIDTARTWL